ncbi:MAG: hypothetical protein AB1306_10320 [Nitrospirota bacterium]
MKNKRYVLWKRCFKLFSSLIIFSLIGCVSMPSTFIMTYEPGWASIEIKEGIKFENAWQEVLDVLAKKFELEMISREGGYIRTAWIYTWWKVGERTENYRVRAIIKFSPDGRNVDIKTEANYLKSGQWIIGADTRLLETVKTDIMGVVGRTTR